MYVHAHMRICVCIKYTRILVHSTYIHSIHMYTCNLSIHIHTHMHMYIHTHALPVGLFSATTGSHLAVAIASLTLLSRFQLESRS